MRLVSVKYKNDSQKYAGKTYTYFCDLPVEVGDIVMAPTSRGEREAMVAELDIPENSIDKAILPKLKVITTLVEKENGSTYFQQDCDDSSAPVTVGDNEKNPEQALILFEDNIELVTVEQLPAISNRIEQIKPKIQAKVDEALALEVNDETVGKIKKIRALLNHSKDDYIEVCSKARCIVMKPIEAYNQTCKTVKDIFDLANKTLGERIAVVENAQKKKKEDIAREHFAKYTNGKNVEFLTFDRLGLKIGLSDTETALRKTIAAKVDKAVDDKALIDTQEYRNEIFVEYCKSLNVASAITTVINRHKEIEAEKERQAEAERIRAEKAAAAKVEQVPMKTESAQTGFTVPEEMINTIPADTVTFKPVAPLAGDAQLFAGFGTGNSVNAPARNDGKKTVVITITDTPERIQALEQNLMFGGYQYGIAYSDNR